MVPLLWRSESAGHGSANGPSIRQLDSGVFRPEAGPQVHAAMLAAGLSWYLALARPQTGSRIEKVKRKGIDLMICPGCLQQHAGARISSPTGSNGQSNRSRG
ncbi:MAG: hypothetical protein MZV63_56335 [Marinilabiliales bacterium]|nr:hypothetical protein [Marinilabiliales bacterium]